MAHDGFPKAMRTFLGNHTRQHRHVLIPYQLPTHKPREDAPERLMAFLWSHKKNTTGAGRRWQPTVCACDRLLRLHPQLQHRSSSSFHTVYNSTTTLHNVEPPTPSFRPRRSSCTSTAKSSAVGCDIISSPRASTSSTPSWTSYNSRATIRPSIATSTKVTETRCETDLLHHPQ